MPTAPKTLPIYRQLLTSMDPSNGDGSFLNLDFTPVPILPKFVRIVTNKILSPEPSPNLEAVDPLSSSEKEKERRKTTALVKNKQQLKRIQEKTGVDIGDVENLPDTLEEAEIFMDNNSKSSSEIAAQIATNMTLKWNDFNDSVYRRCVNDLVSIGIAAVKRSNDPNYGIKARYVDPARLIHSHTEDPNFGDLIYAGEVRRISIQELKRMANGQIEEEEFQKIAEKVAKKYKYDTTDMYSTSYDKHLNQTRYGYDQYMLEILDFEFKSVDRMELREQEEQVR